MPQDELQLLNPEQMPPDNCAAVQVNVLPESDAFNATPEDAPLQMVCAEAEPAGLGFTVTSTVKELPTQPFGDVGITVYLTIP